MQPLRRQERPELGIVIGGSDPTVRQLNGPRMHLRDLVIYELMIDDFTDEFRAERAPLDAVRDKLDHLADDLGVNAILFMPWTAWWDERFNWGYNPYQYFSVEYRYANALGKPAEKLSWLKRLVSECHDRGIHVIMDGVFNHVSYVRAQKGRGFPYFWMYENPVACPYVGRFGGEFCHCVSYLITLSARATMFGGIVMPICLAVFRLFISSNYGCHIRVPREA